MGDKILISGSIAVHGIAIMSVPEGVEFETEVASDTAALHGLVQAIIGAGIDIHVLRDPTRVAGTSRRYAFRRTVATHLLTPGSFLSSAAGSCAGRSKPRWQYDVRDCENIAIGRDPQSR
jgi:hypothetical protein